MSRTKKIALGVVIALVVIVVAAVIVIPLLVDVDRYRPEVTARLQAQTGKPTQMGHLSLTLFPAIAIRVDDFALGNPNGFPEGEFIKAKRIDVVVDGSALWNRQIVIKSLELEQPEIVLLESAKGHWNFENSATSEHIKNASLTSAASFSLGVIAKVTIAHGKVSAANLSASGNPEPSFFEAQGISSELEQVDLNAFAGGGQKTEGSRQKAEGSTQKITEDTGSGEWQVASDKWQEEKTAELHNRQLPARLAIRLPWESSVVYAATPPVFPAGLADSSEGPPAAQGTLNADALRFQTYRVSAVKTKVRLYATEVFLDNLVMDLYGGKAKGDMQFNFAAVNPSYRVKAQVSAVDMSKLLADVPSAKGWMSGKMQGEMDLAGEVIKSPDPLAGMRGTGNINVQNGNLPMLQLNKNLLELAKVGNLGPAKGDPGAFSSIATDLNIAAGRLTSHKINVVGNGVNADGSGSMTLAGDGTLDYQGVASLAAEANQLNTLLAGLAGGTLANGRLTFPFGIGGTLKFPKFIQKGSNSNRLSNFANLTGGKNPAAGQTQNPANMVQGILGAFKKKKQP